MKFRNHVLFMHLPTQSSAKGVGADGKIVLTCNNGDLVEADHVVVTVSTGCMQASHEVMFTPPLPDVFQTALRHIGFGAVGKVSSLYCITDLTTHDSYVPNSTSSMWTGRTLQHVYYRNVQPI